MKSLYIPTSSINFNAVFAMESVSPAAFYGNREFGYRRWERSPPNPYDNCLLLYDKAPLFETHDRERENLPIVIAVDMDAVTQLKEVGTRQGTTTYQTPATIYITPFNCRVLFRTEEERRRVLANATRSLETKLVTLYDRTGCYQLRGGEPVVQWRQQMIEGVDDNATGDLTTELRTERRIDQLKGFMYAYALGAWIAIPEEANELVRLSRAIRNTVMSMAGSLDDAPKAQWELLLRTLLDFERTFERTDPATKRYFESLQVDHQRDGIGGLLADLQTTRGPQGYMRFITDWKRDAKLYTAGTLFNLMLTVRGPATATKAENAVRELETVVANTTKVQKPANKTDQTGYPDFLVEGDIELKTIKDDEKILQPKGEEAVRAIVNAIVKNRYTVRTLIEDRLTVAQTCGLAIKTVLEGGKWEGSSTERYINGLLKNVGLQEPFDIQSTSSPFLKSFAAFILKGDDLEKVQDFAVNNRVGDLRTAFGLHGAIAGFSSLPKTVLETLYADEDLEHLESVYKRIHVALHKTCPVGHLNREMPVPVRDDQPPPETTQTREEKLIDGLIQKMKTKMSKKNIDDFRTKWVPQLRQRQIDVSELETWIRKTKAPKREILGTVDAVSRGDTEQNAQGKTLPVVVVQMLPLTGEQTTNKDRQTTHITFVDDDMCGTDLCQNRRGVEEIAVATRESLATAIGMFQEDFSPDGFYSKNPKEYPRDNPNAINHFVRCLSSKKRKELNVSLTPDEKMALTIWLRTRYGC